MRLIYETLVRNYLESLHSKLRNFTVEPEFLTMWVHDEDDSKSLLEIFLTARSASCPELTVSISAETWSRLNEKWLLRELESLGEMRFDRAPKSSELTVRFKNGTRVAAAEPARKSSRIPAAKAKTGVLRNGRKKAAPLRRGEIHPAYRENLMKTGRESDFESPLPAPSSGSVAVSVTEKGAVLSAMIDPQGLVVAARHGGARGALRVLLDGLCALMPGRPLLEAHDHAIIRLESRLRDPGLPPPVEGLLTPRNADPVFAQPERMVRALFKAYLEKTGKTREENFWDERPGPAWLALNPSERLAKARAAILESCRELGIPESGVEVLDILGGVRIVLGHTAATAHRDFAARMMRLERLVKRKLDGRMELQLESLEDKNRRTERTNRDGKLL